MSGRTIDFPILTYAGLYFGPNKAEPRLIAYGGLCWRFIAEGSNRPRCDIWFDVRDKRLIRPLTLVRWARRMLRVAVQMGETAVFCIRDAEPNSAKLLTLAGLRLAEDVSISFDDGTVRPGEVWQWRP